LAATTHGRKAQEHKVSDLVEEDDGRRSSAGTLEYGGKGALRVAEPLAEQLWALHLAKCACGGGGAWARAHAKKEGRRQAACPSRTKSTDNDLTTKVFGVNCTSSGAHPKSSGS